MQIKKVYSSLDIFLFGNSRIFSKNNGNIHKRKKAVSVIVQIMPLRNIYKMDIHGSFSLLIYLVTIFILKVL